MRIKAFFLTLIQFFWVGAAFSQITWPHSFPLKTGGKVTIYEPQPETFKGNLLTGRAAVSVKEKANSEPVFGAIFFNARMETDRTNRMLKLESIQITKAKFPDASEEGLNKFKQLLEAEIPTWDIEISQETLITAVKKEADVRDANFNTDAPNVIYRTKPSTLVIIDGNPDVRKDDKIGMERVMNTPYLILKNPDDRQYYAYAEAWWYKSNNITSGYTAITKLPNRIASLDQQIKAKEKEAAEGKTIEKPKVAPELIIVNEPAELIQTEGGPDFRPLANSTLLYASNTLDDIFKDVNSQLNYILISGRWYSSSSMNGPWKYVAADKLPEDFAKIQKGSEKDGVLASVAGTQEAEEAIIDTQIPQTAKVDRKTAKVTVNYDGEPKFSAIENTKLKIAENSDKTVLQAANGEYYVCDNGIWFKSPSPKGPFEVANERPSDVESIPASSPAYNTKYVYVYDHTPDYVYCGYTPGYMGCYIFGPTVIWGTGWRYRPWIGNWYYPHPWTWGFNMSYNPWSGWNMGFNFSYNIGWFRFSIGTGYGGFGGWFGPPRYRPPFRPWGYNGGYYGNRPNININRPNININRPNINIGNVNIINNNNKVGVTNNLYHKVPGANTKDINRRPTTRPSGNGNSNTYPSTRPATRPGTTYPTTRPGTGTGTTNPNTRPTTRPSGGGSSTYPSTRPSAQPGTTNPNSRPSTQPGTTNPNTRPATRPSSGGGSTYPSTRPVTREQNNVFSDNNGSIYQRGPQQSDWNQRNNRSWQPATRDQYNQLNNYQQQRDRSYQRQQNWPSQSRPSAPTNRMAPAGGASRARTRF